MKMLHQELSFLVRMHDRNYVPTVYSFMKSEKGGREQDPHQDYTPAAIAKVTNKYPGTIPCSMIVALEEGTKLKVFDGCYQNSDPVRASVIELQPGWCILFCGDLTHCGVGYSKVNFRLHCYVTIEGVKFVPDIVAGVNEREFTCEHRGQQEATSARICQHRFYCSRNPEGHVRIRKNRPKEAPRKCLRCGKTYSAGGYRKHCKKSPPCMPTQDTTEL
ncbi:hypothetical protein PHPALM_28317 [Phytophthora palmivora]|uniref:Uncharacterized protein n=1 Tax=Phytophthora palmivora TaxID=4796 RepID=A0A2P4XAD5_9STRA|nr:hypothetical protein PHPALM_28317 [Phytophthora palmivora]